jgi:hypothetical protein
MMREPPDDIDSWEDDIDFDEDQEYEGCILGEKCCIPSPDHLSSECFTAEMAEEQMKELEKSEKRG